MSSKHYKKAARHAKGGSPLKLLWLLIPIFLAVGLILVLLGREESAPVAEESSAVSTESSVSEENSIPEETPESVPAESIEAEFLFELGDGILITEYVDYSGAFMEDRTDESLSDILGIKVVNTGEKYIQTMDIALSSADKTAEFTLSTLMPGETLVVLEKNRMEYGSYDFSSAVTDNVALFSERPGFCEDRLSIQTLDGIFNITNISGKDIEGDIFVYYKNFSSGVYYGGITYRIRIEGGLKAGEIRQGSAAHFHPENSKVVFVTCS